MHTYIHYRIDFEVLSELLEFNLGALAWRVSRTSTDLDFQDCVLLFVVCVCSSVYLRNYVYVRL